MNKKNGVSGGGKEGREQYKIEEAHEGCEDGSASVTLRNQRNCMVNGSHKPEKNEEVRAELIKPR
ncbi:uncharacterized protein DS421_14g460110 [Arachis hypogaea]|nr:uncharacterized protein DS421_14g460110 [Arachis hypogaea]